MMVPDREIIIKVKLASVGYEKMDLLSKKFNVLYKLCEEQLSKQRHYDFGLRNILSVLRTAGNTKRKEKGGDEEMLLMRSLRDMNLSKLVTDDIQLFNGLLTDIFPRIGNNVPKMVYKEVESKIPEVFMNQSKAGERKGALHNPENGSFMLKIIQLFETSLVRHGFMMVGPTGSGKTTIMSILTETLSQLSQSNVPGFSVTRMVRLNPKAITA
jgi:dynein heavy chain